jgi:Mrp family chromosome partitioning ATPase
VLDRKLKRPKDVQGAVKAPLFLSIPSLRLKANGRTAEGALMKVQGHGEIPLEPDEAMKPFNEALRDRLINYFEVRNMTHMPKMIAVTSCDAGAGVSTVASGLAASLSETGEGNVLLVDARGGPGAAHAFFKGRPACGLDEALAGESRSNALVQGNLYAVSASSPESKLERIMPRQFGHFMPKLRASDYEYIIFDMPPVEPTSVTSKVARFMDMVLMVVEADKTNREVANRAGALLQESKSTVATVLNKRRQYVPKWLLQEFD